MARELDFNARWLCEVVTLEVLARGGRITEMPIHQRRAKKARRIA